MSTSFQLYILIHSHAIAHSYLQAHDMIRGITGIGEGHGPYISIHDGFMGTGSWANFLPGSDRIVLDTHPYFAFDGQPNNAPIVADEGDGSPGGVWPKQACNAWGPGQNTRYVDETRYRGFGFIDLFYSL